MSDYYSYAPTLHLKRPLALVGVPGSGVGKTARAINLTTGVPFVWIDRHVEHRVGRSVELIQLEQGAQARLDVEQVVIAEALKARTPPVLACSGVTWLDTGIQTDLMQHADVLVLDIDPAEAADRILETAKDDPRYWFALRTEAQHDRDRLKALIEAERVRLASLARRVDVSGLAPLTAAGQVVEQVA